MKGKYSFRLANTKKVLTISPLLKEVLKDVLQAEGKCSRVETPGHKEERTNVWVTLGDS